MRLTSADRALATETLVAAFDGDPTWSWMFEGAEDKPAALRGVISILTEGGLVNDSVWCTAGGESVAIWVPPGCDELTPAQEEELDHSVTASGAQIRERLYATFDVFNTARSKAAPHHYLSMFGTRPDKKGKGFGAAVFREALAEIDEASMPCYLESSNPANDEMYEHFGFAPLGRLETPPGCTRPQAMWREARAA
jgi:GNAT superfamily N-acetyltransferase